MTPAAPLFTALLHRPDAARLFEPAALVQALLDVEAALAHSRAACGLQSAASAEAIAAACRVELFDLPELIQAGARAGTVVAPLVQALAARLAGTHPEAEAQLHAGATSQDLIDTAMVLQTRAAWV